MIPLTLVELGNLDGCNATRRPACSSDAYLFVTSGFIHKNKLIWMEMQNLVKVCFLQISVLLTCSLLGFLL